MPFGQDTLSNWHFYKSASWHYTVAWLPCRCDISGKILWLKKAYQGTATYHGPGTPVYEYRWIDRDQFLLEKLKGTI